MRLKPGWDRVPFREMPFTHKLLWLGTWGACLGGILAVIALAFAAKSFRWGPGCP